MVECGFGIWVGYCWFVFWGIYWEIVLGYICVDDWLVYLICYDFYGFVEFLVRFCVEDFE